MQYLISIDIGTTSCKAAALDDQGCCFAVCSIPYPLYHPQADQSEQNPAEILAAVLSCLRKIRRLTRAQGTPGGIAFSAAMHSLTLVDAGGNPLHPLITWADNRAADIADSLRQAHPEWYQRTGTPLHAMSVLPKLIWIRRQRSDLFHTARYFCGIKEYVIYQLTGHWICDQSIASATGLMRLDTLCWDEEILQEAGVGPDRLPRIVPPQYAVPLSPKSGISEWAGIPVVAGASDGCCATLGADANVSGDWALTIGTSSALRAFAPNIQTDPLMRTFCYLTDAARPITGGGANSGAYVLQWMKEQLFQYRGNMDRFMAEAEKAPPGAGNLLFFPWLMGERAPLWNSGLRGAVSGLSTHHTRAHLIRAAMEGVVFNLAGIGKILMEKTPLTRLSATGGFTQNLLWMQICADVFQVPLRFSPGLEVAARGAGMLAREALGMKPMPLLESWQYLYPDPGAATVYEPLFEKFQGSFQ